MGPLTRIPTLLWKRRLAHEEVVRRAKLEQQKKSKQPAGRQTQAHAQPGVGVAGLGLTALEQDAVWKVTRHPGSSSPLLFATPRHPL